MVKTLVPRYIKFRIRQSTLELAECLFRFDQHINHAAPRPDTLFTVRGTAFHKLAYEYVDHLVQTSQSSDLHYGESLVHSGTVSNSEGIRIYQGWFPKRQFQPEWILGNEFDILLDWDFKPADPNAPPHLAPFSGTLDRVEIVDNVCDIYDYKTSWAMFNPTTIQAIFYPWLMRKTFPHLKMIRFHLDFVRYGTIKHRDFTAEEIDESQDQIIELTSRIFDAMDDQKWDVMINSHCNNCTLDCPLIKAGMSRSIVGQILNQDQAKEMAQELYAMENRVSKLKAVLKNYAAENGPIQLPGYELGFKKKVKKVYKVEKIMILNDKYGFEDARALTSDSKEIKRIMRSYPEYVAELDKTAKDQSTTDFQFISREPEAEPQSVIVEEWQDDDNQNIK